jgi:hypothetical protein
MSLQVKEILSGSWLSLRSNSEFPSGFCPCQIRGVVLHEAAVMTLEAFQCQGLRMAPKVSKS